jgi:hypothetical protein
MLSFASHPAFQKWPFGFKRPCGILGVKPCATNSQFSQHGKASFNPCVQRCVHPCALPSDLIPGVPVASVRPARFFHDRDSECYTRRIRAELSWRMGKREEELEICLCWWWRYGANWKFLLDVCVDPASTSSHAVLSRTPRPMAQTSLRRSEFLGLGLYCFYVARIQLAVCCRERIFGHDSVGRPFDCMILAIVRNFCVTTRS